MHKDSTVYLNLSVLVILIRDCLPDHVLVAFVVIETIILDMTNNISSSQKMCSTLFSYLKLSIMPWLKIKYNKS